MAKDGTLRRKYGRDKKAKEFLKKHPEFMGHELDDANRASGMHIPNNPEKQSDAELIVEYLPRYPDKTVSKILRLYYEGAAISELAKLLKKSKFRTSEYIYRAKLRVKKFAQSIIKGTVKYDVSAPIEVLNIVLLNRGKARPVLLVWADDLNQKVWVDSNGALLEPVVQEYLWELKAGTRDSRILLGESGDEPIQESLWEIPNKGRA